jgi:hypothetical protein
MPFIHNEASDTQFWFGLSLAAALMLVLVMVAASFGRTGPATDAMWMVGP